MPFLAMPLNAADGTDIAERKGNGRKDFFLDGTA